MNFKTQPTKQSDVKHNWWQVSADNEILGRLASQIAQRLIGKHKVYYNPSIDCGDYVIVTNVEKVEVSGKKDKQKKYYRHSGFPGGFKEITFEKQLEKDPTKIIIHAVKGMLPNNKLRSLHLKRLKLVVGSTHNFEDKNPQELK
jgi:large subunit ribosomal protein L13